MLRERLSLLESSFQCEAQTTRSMEEMTANLFSVHVCIQYVIWATLPWERGVRNGENNCEFVVEIPCESLIRRKPDNVRGILNSLKEIPIAVAKTKFFKKGKSEI